MSSEKAGIFCDNCPIRNKWGFRSQDKPVALGDYQPVSVATARQMLGHNVPAVRYQTLDDSGRQIGEDATIVVASEISPAQVESAFTECLSPAPNYLKVWKMRLALGQRCMALTSLDEDIHWSLAQSRSGESS